MILFKTFLVMVILVLGLSYFFHVQRKLNWWKDKEGMDMRTPVIDPEDNKPLQYTKPGKVDDPNYVNSENIIYLKNQIDKLVATKQKVAELDDLTIEQGKAISDLGGQIYKNSRQGINSSATTPNQSLGNGSGAINTMAKSESDANAAMAKNASSSSSSSSSTTASSKPTPMA
jgi:hypothetical protein